MVVGDHLTTGKSTDSLGRAEQESIHTIEARWLSAHLFFNGEPTLRGQSGDHVLLEIVEPFIRTCQQNSWISQYFFIRYGELGPHIRLRLQGGCEVLDRKVRPALEEILDVVGDPSHDALSTISACRHERLSHVRWIPYEPEFERYAGPAGLRATETYFFASSEACLALLSREAGMDSSARLAKALLSSIVILHTMSDDSKHASLLANAYSQYALRVLPYKSPSESGVPNNWRDTFEEGYLRQSAKLCDAVRTLWHMLDADQAIPEPFEAFRDSLRSVRTDLKSVLRRGELVKRRKRIETWSEAMDILMPSYLHMMSNRFGLSILDESYLGHLASRLCGSPPVPSTYN